MSAPHGLSVLAPLLALALAVAPAVPVHAQGTPPEAVEQPEPLSDDGDDGGFLTRMIERQLSGDGQTVRLVGFAGVLSAHASFRRLTIADEDGIWLTVEGAELDWDRRALLRGEVQVSNLSAQRIALERLPPGEGSGGGFSLPSPTSSEVTLPALPVGIHIGRIVAEMLELGAPVLGEAVTARIEGSADLEGGSGALLLAAQRTDGPQARLALDAAYDAAARGLRLDIALSEAEGGLLAQALALPDLPSVDFRVQGEGPIGAYQAEIRLATAGTPRLQGTLGFHDLPRDEGLGWGLNLSGDLGPLFAAPYRPFFGPDTRLLVEGQSLGEAGMRLQTLDFASQEAELKGSLELAADGWPRSFDLQGRLHPRAAQVLLPLSGPHTRLGAATLSAEYDVASGDAFRADVTFEGFERAGTTPETESIRARGTRIESGRLSARGHLRRDEGRRLTAEVALDLQGLALADPALAQALGGRSFGTMVVDWSEGAGLELRNLDLSAGATHFLGEAQFSGLDGNLRVTTRSTLWAADLAPFSELAGRPLQGAAQATLDGFYEPLGGAFDLRLQAQTRALHAGDDVLAALAEGDGSVAGRLARGAAGTTFDGLSFATPAVRGQLSGTLGPEDGALALAVHLPDFAVVHPGLPGPAEVQGTLSRAGEGLALDLTTALPGEVALALKGTASTDFATADLTLEAGMPEVRPLVPQLSGPVGAKGSLQLAEGVAQLDLATLLGPEAAPQAQVQVAGSYALEPALADLSLRGSADLALAAPFTQGAAQVAGRADLDLRLLGPLAAESLSGSLAAPAVHVVLPEAGITLPDARLSLQIAPASERPPGTLLAGQLQAALPRIEAPGAPWVALIAGPVELSGLLGLQPGPRLTAEALHLRNGDVQLDGKAMLDLEAGRAEARLGAALASLARLNPLLPADLPLAGAATASLALHHDLNVGRSEAQLSAGTTGLRLGPGTGALALIEPQTQLDLTATLQKGALSVSDLVLVNGNARVAGQGALQPDGTARAQLDLTLGSLARLQSLAGMPLAGALRLGAALGWDGTTGRAQLDGRIAGLSAGTGAVQSLLAGDATLSGLLQLGPEGLRVENARATTPALSLSGTYAQGEAQLDARLDSLGRLVPQLPGPVTASGTLALDRAEGVQLQLSGPAGISARVAGALSSALVPDLRIGASAPLGIANLFAGSAVNVQGQVEAELTLARSLDLAGLGGSVSLSNGAVAIASSSTALQGLSGQATLSGGSAQIALQTGFNTSGRAELAGTVGLSGAMPLDLRAQLAAVEVVQQPTIRTSLNGDLHLAGSLAAGGSLTGAIALGETEISLDFGASGGTIVDLRHVSEPAASRATRARAGLLESAQASGGSGPGPRLTLDVTVSAPSRVFVRGRGLDAELGGELRLTGRAGALIPIGGFELIRGRLDILARRLELSEGSVQLAGDFDPSVRLVATTVADGVTAMITVEGRASHPELTITSNPDLPSEEVLALLLFGRHLQSISPMQALQLANAARTLMSGGEGMQGSVRRGLGLDDLDLATDANGTFAVRAGKYLADNIYIDTTLNAAGELDVQLNLDITPNLTARATAGSGGDTKLGIYYERDY